MHIRHLLRRVQRQPGPLPAPDIQQQHDPRREERHLVEVGRLAGAARLHVEHVDARARGVGADRERGEGERGRLARGGDERAVDRDLELVVIRVEVRGLVQEEQVLSCRVPPDWSRG